MKLNMQLLYASLKGNIWIMDLTKVLHPSKKKKKKLKFYMMNNVFFFLKCIVATWLRFLCKLQIE